MIRNKDGAFEFSPKTKWFLRTQPEAEVSECMLFWSNVMVSHARLTKTTVVVIKPDNTTALVPGGVNDAA